MQSRAHRRFAHWLALAAILLASLLPTVSRSLAAWPGELDICSASQARGPVPSQDHLLLDHCPYCALHADWALPPPLATVADDGMRFHELPEVPPHAPHAKTCWSACQPRAPPLSA